MVSVCSTGEDATIRDSDPKHGGALKRARGAVLCRAAPSFLRFGSFELPARRGDVELVRKLADYSLRHLGQYLHPNRSIDDGDLGDERRGPTGKAELLWGGQEVKMNKEEYRNGDYLGLLVAIVEVRRRSHNLGRATFLEDEKQRWHQWSFISLRYRTHYQISSVFLIRLASCTVKRNERTVLDRR